jgi:hypothetical protein
VLVAFGHVLSFLILFVATAQAAEHSVFASEGLALVCGVASILFVRLYVRIILAARLDASPAATPTQIPLWAVAIYAAIGLAVGLIMMRGGRSSAAIEFLVGWAAGCNLLNYLWTRRIRPETPEALQVVDTWFRAQAAQYRSTSTTLGFLLLFAGVGAHAFESGFAAAVAAQCGPACATPVFIHLAAALCGIAAILFVMLYATVMDATRWILVDSWRHVRPGPPPPDLPRWIIALHGLIGLGVFFAMTKYGLPSAARPVVLGSTYLMDEGLSGGRSVILDGGALLEMVLAWWLGGSVVLKFFWLRRRARH